MDWPATREAGCAGMHFADFQYAASECNVVNRVLTRGFRGAGPFCLGAKKWHLLPFYAPKSSRCGWIQWSPACHWLSFYSLTDKCVYISMLKGKYSGISGLNRATKDPWKIRSSFATCGIAAGAVFRSGSRSCALPSPCGCCRSLLWRPREMRLLTRKGRLAHLLLLPE